MLTDERYKQLMEGVGLPNSRSFLQTLKQCAMEAVLSERAVMKKLGEQEPVEWFYAKDKLPDPDTEVWICVKNKNKQDGIWLHDICWHEGDKWAKRERTWEDIVLWAYPVNPFLKRALPAQAVLEWNDRSKIAPKREPGEKILAFGGGYVFEAECDEDGDWCSIGGDDFTHWMPMPDQPMLSTAPKP
jgi:hypothetical protein